MQGPRCCFLTGIVFVLSSRCIGAILVVKPTNIAVEAGSSFIIPCRIDTPEHSVFWNYSQPGSYQWQALFNGFIFNPKFDSTLSSRYTIDKSKDRGQCDIVVKTADQAHAGTYKCIENVIFSSADSQVIVLASDPVCHSHADLDNVVMTCSVNYSGNWAPLMKWQQVGGTSVITDGVVNVNIPYKSVSYSLRVEAPVDSLTNQYWCTTYFSESNRPPGTNATNVPTYTYTWTTHTSSTPATDIKSYTQYNKTSQYSETSTSSLTIFIVAGVSLFIIGVVITSLLFVGIRKLKQGNDTYEANIQESSGQRRAGDYTDLRLQNVSQHQESGDEALQRKNESKTADYVNVIKTDS